jgi:tetratricopeptide (TPR) repeat protein
MNRLDSAIEVAPGEHLVFESDQDGAEYFYRKALEFDPRHYESLMGLGGILPELSEERLSLMELAVALQPSYRALIEIGDYYRSVMHDLTRALENYEKARFLRIRDKTVYQKLSEVCRQLGRVDEAELWIARWEEVDKNRKKVGRATDIQ